MPGATSVLVLVKLQFALLHVWVKPAVGGALTGGGGGATVTVWVSASVAPSSSVTVSVTVKSVEAAAVKLWRGLATSATPPSPKVHA